MLGSIYYLDVAFWFLQLIAFLISEGMILKSGYTII